MKKLINLFVPIFIVFIATVLIIIWFHEGLILGTAEAEIPFYNLERFKHITSWAWFDFNLGSPSSSILASWPTWWFLSKIQSTGVAGFVVQAFIFWFLLISAGIGIYWLTKISYPSLSKRYLILAVLFYYFNPISLVIVWNRFLYNYIFFWVLLPIALFLFIKGLKEKNFVLGVVTALTLTFFSYALSGYVFNLLIWFIFIFTWLFFIFVYFEKKFILFSTKFLFLTLISFVLLNSWWILSTFSYVFSSNTTKELSYFVTSAGNLYTLNLLSQKLGNLIDITRLSAASFYLNEGPKWADFYLSPVLLIILFATTGVVFFGIYKLRKHKEGLFLGSLFVLGLFLAKGNNPPFGIIFQWPFEKLSFLQVFRDPFEKFGFIISLSAAPLFAVGIKELTKIFNGKIRTPIYLSGLFAVLIVFGYPFFTGLVFTSKSPPNDDYSVGYKVKVPDYYKEADQWLKSKGNNFRFIAFPLGDEGMTYKWEKGYQGVEPSGILFSIPGITLNTTIPYYSQIAEKIENLLFEKEDFIKVANLLNVRYFLVRNDVDINERRLRKPEAIEAILRKSEQEGRVKKVAQFDKLTFWENLEWKDKTIYSATNLLPVFPQPKITESIFPGVEDQVVLSGLTNKMEDPLVIYPQTNISYQKKERCFQLIGDFENPKKYTFNTNQQSEYEVLLDNTNFSPNEASLAAKLKVQIDYQPLKKGKLVENKIISYGKINLVAGKHELDIERPVTSNLVSAPGNIILKVPQGNNQASFKIENFNSYSRYLVSFDYMNKLGQTLVFYFQQNNDLLREGNIAPECLNINILNQESSFGSFTHVGDIYTPKRSDEASVLFSINPNQNAEFIIKNLSVNRLIEPEPVLIKQTNNMRNFKLPQITYTKINPTKYLVKVTNANSPFILVLSELFNGGWEAYFDDHTKASDHFLANAYANGWFIDKTGDFNLTLEFAPQRLLNIGKIISGLSLIAGLVFIVSMLLKRRKGI